MINELPQGENRLDRVERLLLANLEQTMANTQAIAQNSREIGDLRAAISDMREIQAEAGREFNGLIQVFRLSLMRMEESNTRMEEIASQVRGLQTQVNRILEER
ncbi:hypothetical protein [Anthocerotibacter panamensis]|uniref:hypothetical protein n=1 Tax=Anthocerotibacter panamensis TaxID=2857077 RepID=UPI001C40697A|nr:hypothetical protein [Anthocerotibacter panamensis]